MNIHVENAVYNAITILPYQVCFSREKGKDRERETSAHKLQCVNLPYYIVSACTEKLDSQWHNPDILQGKSVGQLSQLHQRCHLCGLLSVQTGFAQAKRTNITSTIDIEYH